MGVCSNFSRFINNEFVKGVDGKQFETINPTNEKPICSVHEALEKDVDIAVGAARKAFEGEWRTITPQQRGRYLTKLADLMERDADILASIESLDNGKAKGIAATADVPMSYNCIRYYGGWSDKIEGKVIDTNAETLAYTKQEPVSILSCRLPFVRPTYKFSDWRLRSDHPLELPNSHVVVEDRPCHRMW